MKTLKQTLLEGLKEGPFDNLFGKKKAFDPKAPVGQSTGKIGKGNWAAGPSDIAPKNWDDPKHVAKLRAGGGNAKVAAVMKAASGLTPDIFDEMSDQDADILAQEFKKFSETAALKSWEDAKQLPLPTSNRKVFSAMRELHTMLTPEMFQGMSKNDVNLLNQRFTQHIDVMIYRVKKHKEKGTEIEDDPPSTPKARQGAPGAHPPYHDGNTKPGV